MANDISKIILPNSDQYNLKDAQVRTIVQTINNVYISKTQPNVQREGTIWLRLVDE